MNVLIDVLLARQIKKTIGGQNETVPYIYALLTNKLYFSIATRNSFLFIWNNYIFDKRPILMVFIGERLLLSRITGFYKKYYEIAKMLDQ